MNACRKEDKAQFNEDIVTKKKRQKKLPLGIIELF